MEIFLEMELRGLSPNFHIHVSVGDLYIPTIGLPILLQETMWTDRGTYTVSRSQIHKCGNWDWGRAIPFLKMHKWDFRCNVAYSKDSALIHSHRWFRQEGIPESWHMVGSPLVYPGILTHRWFRQEGIPESWCMEGILFSTMEFLPTGGLGRKEYQNLGIW